MECSGSGVAAGEDRPLLLSGGVSGLVAKSKVGGCRLVVSVFACFVALLLSSEDDKSGDNGLLMIRERVVRVEGARVKDMQGVLSKKDDPFVNEDQRSRKVLDD
jgi:hypothetical protein